VWLLFLGCWGGVLLAGGNTGGESGDGGVELSDISLRDDVTVSTVYFDKRGGTGGSDGGFQITYGWLLPKGLEPPTKLGYTFTGYYAWNSAGSFVTYYYADMYSTVKWDIKEETAILTAVWVEDKITVYLESNGGSPSYTLATSLKENGDFDLDTINIHTRTGYALTGYYASIDENSKRYIGFDNGTLTQENAWGSDKNGRIFAHWEKTPVSKPEPLPTPLTIELDNNGADGGNSNTTLRADGDFDINSISVPTKGGYEFLGYFKTTSDGSKRYIAFENGVLTQENKWDSAEDGVIYAHWKKKDEPVTPPEPTPITIKLDNNGANENNSFTILKADGNFDLGSITASTKDGFVFKGYFDAIDGDKQYIAFENGVLSQKAKWDSDEDGVIYAQWEAVEEPSEPAPDPEPEPEPEPDPEPAPTTPSDPGNDDKVAKDPSTPNDNTLLYVLIGAAIVVFGVMLYFIFKKKESDSVSTSTQDGNSSDNDKGENN